MARRRLKKRLRFLLFTQLTCSGCFSATPFQSARVVESGENNGSLSVLRTRPREGPDQKGWTSMEFGTRVPLGGGRTDLGLNGTLVSYDPMGDSRGRRPTGFQFGIGVKTELIDDVLSLELPVKMMYAGTATLYTTLFYPRAIVSVPINDYLEVNLSATRFLFAGGTENTPWGFAAGLAIGKRGGAVFRPEIGVLDYPDGNDMIQFGIAYTPEFRTSPPKEVSTERTPH